MTFWLTWWQERQFFFCARSGFAHAGAEIMQAVTIETKCEDFMRVPKAAAQGRSATMQDNGRARPALTRERNRAPEVPGGHAPLRQCDERLEQLARSRRVVRLDVGTAGLKQIEEQNRRAKGDQLAASQLTQIEKGFVVGVRRAWEY